MQDVERYAQFCVFVNISEALKAYYILCKCTNTYSEWSTTKRVPYTVVIGLPHAQLEFCVLSLHPWAVCQIQWPHGFLYEKREGNDMRRETSATATHFLSFDKEANVALC